MKKINAEIKKEIMESIANSECSIKLLTQQEYENFMTETRPNEIKSCQEYYLMMGLFYSPFKN